MKDTVASLQCFCLLEEICQQLLNELDKQCAVRQDLHSLRLHLAN